MPELIPLKNPLWDSVESSLYEPHGECLEGSLWSSLWTSLGDSLRGSLERSLGSLEEQDA